MSTYPDVVEALGDVPKLVYDAKVEIGCLSYQSFGRFKNTLDENDSSEPLFWLFEWHEKQKRNVLSKWTQNYEFFSNLAIFLEGYERFQEHVTEEHGLDSSIFLMIMSALDRWLMEGNYKEYKALYNRMYNVFITHVGAMEINIHKECRDELLKIGMYKTGAKKDKALKA